MLRDAKSSLSSLLSHLGSTLMPLRFLHTSPRQLFGLLVVVAFWATLYWLRRRFESE
jgi:hypothetical protein